MNRWLIALFTVFVLGGVAIWTAIWFRGQSLAPIRVGILHSETGPMAISEKSMIDAEKLAINEINKQGYWAVRSNGWLLMADQTGQRLRGKRCG